MFGFGCDQEMLRKHWVIYTRCQSLALCLIPSSQLSLTYCDQICYECSTVAHYGAEQMYQPTFFHPNQGTLQLRRFFLCCLPNQHTSDYRLSLVLMQWTKLRKLPCKGWGVRSVASILGTVGDSEWMAVMASTATTHTTKKIPKGELLPPLSMRISSSVRYDSSIGYSLFMVELSWWEGEREASSLSVSFEVSVCRQCLHMSCWVATN